MLRDVWELRRTYVGGAEGEKEVETSHQFEDCLLLEEVVDSERGDETPIKQGEWAMG